MERLIQMSSMGVRELKVGTLKNAWEVISLREVIIHQKDVSEDPDDPKYYIGENPVLLHQWKDAKILDYVTEIHNACLDDRDRIYALLSLASENDIKMSPDYTKSTGQVYSEFAMNNLILGEIRILNYAGTARLTGKERVASPLPDLPSWAPDWRIREDYIKLGGSKQAYVLRRYKVSGKSAIRQTEFHTENPSLLARYDQGKSNGRKRR